MIFSNKYFFKQFFNKKVWEYTLIDGIFVYSRQLGGIYESQATTRIALGGQVILTESSLSP
jgi:hypothetical protein